jgi:pimeloyl-ACP methyl ester carboxylesterase
MLRASLVHFGKDLAARVRPGSGEGVLWLHGYTLDSTSWSGLWNLLPDWSHIGLDLPGHGASLPLSAQDGLPQLARYIGRVAIEKQVRHIVALSFGTLIGLQIVIEYPRAFRTLTLGAPALGGGPQDSEIGTRYQELTDLYGRCGFTTELRQRWMQSPPNIFKGAEQSPELWERLRRIVGRHPWWELEDGSYFRLSNHPQTKNELQQVEASTLVLVGDNELSPFKRSAELIRRSIPGCRRLYLPAVGHLCMLEAETEVAPLLDQHWRGAHD